MDCRWNRGEWIRDRNAFIETSLLASKQAESEKEKDPFNPKVAYLVKKRFSSRLTLPKFTQREVTRIDLG
jgi:hypothetical protein